MGNIRDRLQITLVIVNELERSLAGKNFQDFAANAGLLAAAERYLERISTALGHLPQSVQIKYPDVDWQGISEIGNLLRHVYDRTLDQQAPDKRAD
jgi:uncharacterized protein with HEPN domain